MTLKNAKKNPCFPVLAKVLNVTLLAYLIASPGISCAHAAPHVLWQIGQEDRDDKEFFLAPNHWNQYREDSVYIVGKSTPDHDWAYVHPGPSDNWAGNHAHTNTIHFALTKATTQGTCHLTLALADSHQQRPPQIQISVNGKIWTRNTVRGGGDDSIEGQPSHGVASNLDVEFPAELLKVGVNTIKITNFQGSWMIYDAVSLTTPDEDTLGVAPTIFSLNSVEWLRDVLKRDDKGLQQVLKLELYNSGTPREVEVHITGEAPRPLTISGGRSTVELSFPESQVASKTEVQLFEHGQPIGDPTTVDRQPCRHYTIYCIEHSHMDIGYNHLPAKALTLHQGYLEEGLKRSAEVKDLPYDERFRWNLESLYEADDWLKKATPTQIAAFQAAVRNGDLGLSALYCNELTGLCRPEELVALLACANRLRNQLHIPIDSAMITDVPGYTWGLVPVLAQSGVKYISLGPNGGDHTGFARNFDAQAFYWQSPSGKDRILVWQSPNAYYPEFDLNDASLAQFLKNFNNQHPNYPYDLLYNRNTVGDNGPSDPNLPAFVHNWNSRYAFPHLVLSTTSRMFHDFEARYGKTLPTLHGDYTGFWEDGAASTARETSINRQAAETVAQDQTLFSLIDPTHYPHARFEDAWKNAVLYDEHTWGADRSWSEPESDFTKQQWESKKQFALNVQQHSQALQKDAFKTITTPGSSTIAVFNTGSWKRSDLVLLPHAMSTAGDVVCDSQGKTVASQRLKDGSLAFMATDIPAMSSRKYQVLPGTSRTRGSAVASKNILKTGSMSLQVDPKTGAITSWKVNGIAQDLVNRNDKTSRGLNDYMYILGDKNDTVQYASGAKITVVDSGPLVATLRIDSAAPGSKTLSRFVRVADGLNQIRIEDTVDKLAVHQDEAVHFGFNLNVPSATVRMDMPWSVIRPQTDQTINSNKNVYPVGRWADISNDAFGVTCANLDSPMMQIGEITAPREAEGAWLKTPKTGSTIYWNVMNNYWHTNYKAYQPGVARFRYVLNAHGKYDQSSVQRFGIDQSQPLLFTPVKSNQPDIASPLMLDNTAVLVTQCHPAADGKGWLVRLFNSSNQTQTLTLAWKGNKNPRLAETDLWGNSGKARKNPLSLKPMEIVTLRISL